MYIERDILETRKSIYPSNMQSSRELDSSEFIDFWMFELNLRRKEQEKINQKVWKINTNIWIYDLFLHRFKNVDNSMYTARIYVYVFEIRIFTKLNIEIKNNDSEKTRTIHLHHHII